MEAMTGVSTQKMLGKEDREYSDAFYHEKRPLLIDLVFASQEEIMLRGYTSIKRKGVTVEAETFLITREGKTRSFWVTAAPLFDEHGAVAGAIESVRDISADKNAKELSGRNESRFRGLFEHSALAIAVFDEDGDFVEMNRTCHELLGPKVDTSWKDFNLFRGRILSASDQEAMAKGENVRFSISRELPGTIAEDTVFPAGNLDIQVIPLLNRQNLPVYGFIMQFRETRGGNETLPTLVSQ
jgi:PAS domain-containing protein